MGDITEFSGEGLDLDFFDGFLVDSDMGCGAETSCSLSELSEDTMIELAL